MKGKSSDKNPNQQDESKYVGVIASVQETPPCPSAAVRTPAAGQGVNHVSEDAHTVQDRDHSMALPVTRHASTPTVTGLKRLMVESAWCLRNPYQHST
jgi:BRCT domain type II-containing protein